MPPEITDKLGRPSAEDSYGIATTVDAIRIADATVLECVDLSTWNDETPVYFVTYQKTVDPVTNQVSITGQKGWKGLVDHDTNNITDLTIAPGYVDDGNEIGDYAECIPTALWGNDLMDVLLGTHNPDGTLKPVSEVQTVDVDDAVIKFSVAETEPDPDPDGKIIIWFEPLA